MPMALSSTSSTMCWCKARQWMLGKEKTGKVEACRSRKSGKLLGFYMFLLVLEYLSLLPRKRGFWFQSSSHLILGQCCDKSALGCSRKCRDSWLNTEDSMLSTLPQSCQTSHQHLPDSSRLPARGICSSNSYYLLLCFNAGFLLVISTCIRMI
jgi:hypothetical protein